MKKIKRITINYIEGDKGKRESFAFEDQTTFKKNLIETFMNQEEIPENKKDPFIVLEKPRSLKKIDLQSILIIGPQHVSGVHFSEKIYEEFENHGFIVEYISPHLLKIGTSIDDHLPYMTREKLYPLSRVLKKSRIKPDLIFIEECEFWWDNDVNIPVFYKHREFKRPPTVYYPDVAFHWHEDIITYFKKMFAPNWMSKIKHHFPMYPAVDLEQYKPSKKKYKGCTWIGYREDITEDKAYDFPELANVADLILLKKEELIQKESCDELFETPITNEQYRETLPQCEAIWVPLSVKQFISRRMLEAMACKTVSCLHLENERHEQILKNMGFTEGVHYLTSNLDISFKSIADVARDVVIKNHTYTHRMNEIINYYETLGFQPERYDVICPVYWTNEFFMENVQNWFEEIPINKLYLGINNPDVMIKIDDPRIEVIDQVHLKTLGACLAGLMKRVETRWFVFLHADVHVNEHSFDNLKSFISEGVGIIESERVHWNGGTMIANNEEIPAYTYDNYKERTRSFSGFQLMRKQAIEPILNKIEDDFIYRNEDLIFHSECVKNGYEYKKTWSMHVHQTIDQKWTRDWIETHVMQWKGLVKYTQPLDINKEACLAPLRILRNKNEVRIQDVIIFCQMFNPNWAQIIVKEWEKQ